MRPLIMHIREGTLDYRIFHEIWTEKVYDNCLKRTDEIIIDVGSHIGFFTLFAARKCPTAKIFSYEPDPDNFKLLTRNIELNDLSARVQASKIGLSGKNGKRILHVSETKNTGSRSIIYSYENEHTLEIDTITLSEVCRRHTITHIDFLKIDVENAEAEILFAPESDKILDLVDNISIEFHSRIKYNEIKNFLIDKDFRFERVSGIESEGGGTCNFYKVETNLVSEPK